jgi:hypothetical protein
MQNDTQPDALHPLTDAGGGDALSEEEQVLHEQLVAVGSQWARALGSTAERLETYARSLGEPNASTGSRPDSIPDTEPLEDHLGASALPLESLPDHRFGAERYPVPVNRPTRTSPTWRGAAATLVAVLLVAVFARVLVGFASSGQRTESTTTSLPTATMQPTATPQPVRAGAATTYDPRVASELAYAYAQGSDIFVSIGGGQPTHVLHVDLPSDPAQIPSFAWGFAWSPDHSLLLVTAAGAFNTLHHTLYGAWVVTLPAGTVTILPKSSPIVDACAGIVCLWVGNRFVLYQGLLPTANRTWHYGLYDTVAQRSMATALDAQSIQYRPVVRGDAVYFTPAGKREIDRFDVATNRITKAFDLPGPVVISNSGDTPDGGWDLSADASRLVFVPASDGSGQACASAGCGLYQDASGQARPILAVSSTRYVPRESISIAPDGTHAAVITYYAKDGKELLQQRLPDGSVSANALESPVPNDYGDYEFIGWSARTSGIFLRVAVAADLTYVTGWRVYFVPLNQDTPARLILDVAATFVVFA